MTRFATAATTAAFIAAAGTASLWVGWMSAARDGRVLQGAAELESAAVPEWGRYRDQGGRPSQSYYGWTYPYIFPFERPQVIARRPITETRR
jgi:hypothetical protein